MGATHYLYEEDILCSTSAENIEYSSSILKVSCGHCWKKYDELEDRTVNVQEMRSCACGMRHRLKTAARVYLSEDTLGEDEFIAEYAFWFLEGPDSLPDKLKRVHDIDAPAMKAGHGMVRSRFMKAPKDKLNNFGIESQQYREYVDQLLRALRPALSDNNGNTRKDRIPSTLKRSAFERDGEKCDICDAPLKGSESKSPTIDHVIPEALGGPTEEWNLRVLCESCNAFKHVMIDPGGVEKIADRLEKKITE